MDAALIPPPEALVAWIRVIAEDAAVGRLADVYRTLVDPDSGRVDNILKIHSLNFDGLSAHVALYRSAMAGTAGLPKCEREMIALVVSGLNGCHY